jgi:hypothetical protein
MFIEEGGFHQLIKCVIELNVTEVDSMLKLKCLKDLIALISMLLKEQASLLAEIPGKQLVHRLLDHIELICDFSNQSEFKRGYTIETLQNKIEAARIRK